MICLLYRTVYNDFVVPSSSQFPPRYCLDPKYNAVLDPAIAFEIQWPGGAVGFPWGKPSKRGENHGKIQWLVAVFEAKDSPSLQHETSINQLPGSRETTVCASNGFD